MDKTTDGDASASCPLSLLTTRSFEENAAFIRREDPVNEPYVYTIALGFLANMRVPGRVFMNEGFARNLFEELRQFLESGGKTFPPALLQVANVASLPGVVDASVGLPDIHSGYGFAVGNAAAFDLDDPNAIVSAGGVGFDINCGVRMLRTNLTVAEFEPLKEAICDVRAWEWECVGNALIGNDLFRSCSEGFPWEWARRAGCAWTRSS
jgi:hypothetical protein